MDDCWSVVETTGQYIKSVSADLFYNYDFGWIYTSSRRQAGCPINSRRMNLTLRVSSGRVQTARSSLCRT